MDFLCLKYVSAVFALLLVFNKPKGERGSLVMLTVHTRGRAVFESGRSIF